MLVYVATRHRIFRGAGSVICLPATSAMIVQAMQTCTVVDVVSFFPQYPSAECFHVLTNTHKDTHHYNNIATFSNVNMHVSSSFAFNLKYCTC